ncbi:MAG: isochorismate synthase [Cyanobacteriota bacterium]|nr:isochorismate synthase [Cyanobacteriota bacterium]
MQDVPAFHALLANAEALAAGLEPEGVLSLALPLAPIDPLAVLPQLAERAGDGFRFLWDGAPGLCIAAAGRCNSLELSGPRRFELAQRFCSATLGRLGIPDATPALARPRVLLAFAFFDAPLHPGPAAVPGVQAVLPRWQLSRHGQHCWLRINQSLGGDVTPRQMAEELWDTAQALITSQPAPTPAPAAEANADSAWPELYRASAQQGLDLVNSGALHKLVLAVRQELVLERSIDPLSLLAPLRRHQSGSCRFLWQRDHQAALLGASPERLLTVRSGQLRSDALAGTAAWDSGLALLSSDKDRREHELVVEAITAGLQQAGLQPRRPRRPRLARHGRLVHLHTPITAPLAEQHPLALAGTLHPTPAVAGLPRREAMGWLRSLEPFERGHYAAPIGWIDSAGDTDLRVAIRSGTLRSHRLELTAGAGLVRGSELERELQEVALKLGVLQQQLSVPLPQG